VERLWWHRHLRAPEAKEHVQRLTNSQARGSREGHGNIKFEREKEGEGGPNQQETNTASNLQRGAGVAEEVGTGEWAQVTRA